MAAPGVAASSGIPSLTSTAISTAFPTLISVPSSSPPSNSSSALSPSSTTLAPTYIFSTPSITTTFTPPPECTQGHITMLERQHYFVWENEPLPVPNSTFSECYPSQFMTSYLQSYSSTIAPAFSPLVCPDNYETVYTQTMTNRPVNFGLHPPDTTTPGRPAFGATCYSNMINASVTQYDNSSSSGVMVFSSSGQAYAHPIDGFALETSSSMNSAAPLPTTFLMPSIPTQTPTAIAHVPVLSDGAIAGVVLGAIAALVLVLSAFILLCRRRRGSSRPLHTDPNRTDNDRYGGPPNAAQGVSWVNEKALPPRPPEYTKQAELYSSWPRKPSELSATCTSFYELPGYTNLIPTELESAGGAGNRPSSRSQSKTPAASVWVRSPGRRSPSRPSSARSEGRTSPPKVVPLVSPDGSSVPPISLTGRSQIRK
ncbi:MAG: hypothetical protein LQ340_005880 [Diploschistes diacapsis]|nr:MAG: hypothetical protein LQ340_005880 [Diploschistes diacapsis]